VPTAIPEPGALGLLAFGGACFFAGRHRAMRRRQELQRETTTQGP